MGRNLNFDSVVPVECKILPDFDLYPDIIIHISREMSENVLTAAEISACDN